MDLGGSGYAPSFRASQGENADVGGDSQRFDSPSAAPARASFGAADAAEQQQQQQPPEEEDDDDMMPPPPPPAPEPREQAPSYSGAGGEGGGAPAGAPRPGRRAAAAAAGGLGGYGVDNIPRGPPAEQVEVGGEEKHLAGVSRRKQDQRRQEAEEKERAKSKYDDMVERAGSIENIMELEEEGREDLSRMVADAPKVRTNKVQNITDLDEDMHYRLPSNEDREIDLSLLTTFLCSSEQVYEPDEVWDPDMLFTAVASELHHEKERAETLEGADKDPEVAPTSNAAQAV